MRIDVITIFPELFVPSLTIGMIERARRKGSLEVRLHDLRGFTEDRHRSVDDRPYGGGPGMLLKPEPVFRAMDLLGSGPEGERGFLPILLCPQGRRLDQEGLQELSEQEHLLLLCGRYEGFDERICTGFPWRRYSIGDFVLSGGEVPALVIIEGIARLLPGVLGHEESATRDSFSEWAGGSEGLDHPHFTRPPSYRGREVPEVLRSGNHEAIEAWRRRESAAASRRRAEGADPDHDSN